jgi:hypothetical protein
MPKQSNIALVPDATYPNMWRVRLRDGSLSDRYNAVRAMDLALALSRKPKRPQVSAEETRGRPRYRDTRDPLLRYCCPLEEPSDAPGSERNPR